MGKSYINNHALVVRIKDQWSQDVQRKLLINVAEMHNIPIHSLWIGKLSSFNFEVIE